MNNETTRHPSRVTVTILNLHLKSIFLYDIINWYNDIINQQGGVMVSTGNGMLKQQAEVPLASLNSGKNNKCR